MEEAGSVLIVEDDRANQESLEKIFQREGFRVFTAPDGPTALNMLRREPVQVVLTDLMMPGMSGVDLHEELERIAPDQAARTGFLTGGAFTSRARSSSRASEPGRSKSRSTWSRSSSWWGG